MSSINKVILVCRLGKDPEYKQFASGQGVCKLAVATSKKWNDKQGQSQSKTEWHNVVVFGKRGEICAKYLTKGQEVYIEGELQTRNYEDAQGSKRYITEIVANDVQFLSKAHKEEQAQDYSGEFAEPQVNTYQEDEMPF